MAYSLGKILKFEVQGMVKSCILGGYLIDELCILYFMRGPP